MASQRATEIRVGLFVCVALFVGAIVIFVIGSANQQFDKSVPLYTSFASVSGLQMGSQVRLSGLKVGVVERVWIVSKEKPVAALLPAKANKVKGQPDALTAPLEKGRLGCHPPPFSLKRIRKLLGLREGQKLTQADVSKTLKVSFICVQMKVIQSSLKHIRSADSVAMVKGKGLLGDSLIEISMGVKGARAKESGFVRGLTPKGLSDLMAEGGEVVTKLKASLASVETILAQYTDPKLANDLKGIVGSVNAIIGRVQTGPGLLHDLFYDKRLTRDAKRAIAMLQRLTNYLGNTVAQINYILRQAKRPKTLIHTLLLSRKSGKFARDLRIFLNSTRRAVDSLRAILDAPKKEGTLLNHLLYKKKTGKIVADLLTASQKLRLIMDRINRGKGTLGAFINDPTAYEDFKTILGQVKRNRVFRTLIRFIIQRDDSVKGGKVVKN